MPRQSRIDAPGALHHIIVRGIERRKIFIDDQDRHDFINRLENIPHRCIKNMVKAQGVDLDYVVDRVARIFEMKSEHLWMPGKSRQQVTSRSLLCFWAVRELGESMASLAKRLNISTAAISKSVVRGAEIADREGHELI